MGRKKSKRVQKKPRVRRKIGADTHFDCPICNREKTVSCKLMKSEGCGISQCSSCGNSHRCHLKHSETTIDVYYSWIDSLDHREE